MALTKEELLNHNYPLQPECQASPTIETSPEVDLKVCSRCSSNFKLVYPLTAEMTSACNYHWGSLRNAKYSCCSCTAESPGCCIGPHVYRNDSDVVLHTRSPFTKLNNNASGHEVLALDCEMGYTLDGFELIRVTVLDWYEKIVLDTLVKPDSPILCLNTRFSGVKTLEGPKLSTLAQVKTKLNELASDATLLIGHGLENDLRVLRVSFRTKIDMS